MANKIRTMRIKGGNTNQLYEGDGRLRMARALERAWPGTVAVSRRFGRPQHVINWTKFKTPLDPKPREEWPLVDYDLRLAAKREVRAPGLRAIQEEVSK